MTESDKKKFWQLINTCASLCNLSELSKSEIIQWWQALEKYKLDDIEYAINAHLELSAQIPTINEIEKSIEAHIKDGMPKSVAAIIGNIPQLLSQKKDNTDYLRWARNMDRNPQNYRSDYVDEARQILRKRGFKLAGDVNVPDARLKPAVPH